MNSAYYEATQAVKGIKKSFDNALRNKIKEYMGMGFINFYNTSEVSEIFSSTEGLDGSKELGELETPPSLALDEGYKVTITEKRFGGAIVVPEKVYRRDGQDRTWKVDQYLKRQRNQLLLDSVNLLCTRAHLMLNEAHSSSSDYLAPDGVEVCGAHTWNSGGTFDNSTTGLLTSSAVDTAEEYAGDFVDPAGKPMPLNFSHIIVKKGTANHREAIRLFAKEIKPTAVADINIYEGMYTIVETPYITTANKNYWFMADLRTQTSPLAVGIGEYPTLREPIKERDESIRSNCTGFWKQGVINMPYQYYGGDGT